MSQSRATTSSSIKGKTIIAKVYSHGQLLICYWVFNNDDRGILSAHMF